MTTEVYLIFAVLAATMALFIFSPWRHDMVAVASLLACVFLGLVPPESAFAGFGHPAVITVACVLVLSRMLQTSGAVDIATKKLLPKSAGPFLTIAILTALGAVLSAFMNNVGALALLMPVGIQYATKKGIPIGKVLMPLAFGSILGGMTTLIGTPPNLIVSGFRENAGLGSYAMFDFTPVGAAAACAGVLFILLAGNRLIPSRNGTDVAGFHTGAYMTEARITKKAKLSGNLSSSSDPTLRKQTRRLWAW